ncbi:acyltransferase family protein [Paraburkholderia gardini]|uniref:acyltransferase family protein n=1 Tax=Paraburkholderia gardini TaxID=2823469 RepID=UPI001D440A3A|nr:acyltransferase [Paraburkholderia gardini]CAG4889264.1 O-acetyltransferase OatA [Paraburkholderia gardini]
MTRRWCNIAIAVKSAILKTADTKMSNENPRHWFPALDGLRAVAAFAVLIDHLYPPSSIIQRWFHFGRFGVDIFFVLSGFLIVGNLLKMKANANDRPSALLFLQFYAKRALRIFPIYYAVIFALLIAGIAPTPERLGWLLTYTSNIGSAFHITYGNLEHFWTLCVEEQFYIIVPTLVLIMTIHSSLRALVLFCAMGTAVKVAIGFATHDWALSTRFVFENLEGLTYGACLAYAWTYHHHFERFRKIALLAIIPAAIALAYLQYMRTVMGAPVYNNPVYIGAIDLTMTLTFGPLVILCIASDELPILRLLKLVPLRYLGRISYGTYIYHYALIPFYPRIFGAIGLSPSNPWESKIGFCMAVFITYALSALSWHLFEAPILSLKRICTFSFQRPASAPEECR